MTRPATRLLAALLLLAGPAAAQSAPSGGVSDRIAAEGLARTEAALAALPAPDPSDRFALGGVRFLRGVERALQLRYAVGLSDGLAVMSGLPVLRLPIPENPSPAPFEPAMVEALFTQVEADMAGAIAVLEGIGDADAVAVEIEVADLWFDIDADGARGAGEGLAEVAGVLLADPFADPFAAPAPAPAIRFDTADAAWLLAYAHLLSAASEAMLAVGPAEAIGRVLDARDAFDALGAPPPFDGFGLATFADGIDLAAMAILAVEGRPDPARTRAARLHLLATVENSRRFWTLVAREEDDEREWIPNKRQASATGLPFPPETGPAWLAVLSDAEGILSGRLLVPHWRLGPNAGLDLAAFLEDPPEIDAAALIQGATLVPYLREGPVADRGNVARFAALVRGDAVLYAAVLN